MWVSKFNTNITNISLQKDENSFFFVVIREGVKSAQICLTNFGVIYVVIVIMYKSILFGRRQHRYTCDSTMSNCALIG